MKVNTLSGQSKIIIVTFLTVVIIVGVAGYWVGFDAGRRETHLNVTQQTVVTHIVTTGIIYKRVLEGPVAITEELLSTIPFTNITMFTSFNYSRSTATETVDLKIRDILWKGNNFSCKTFTLKTSVKASAENPIALTYNLTAMQADGKLNSSSGKLKIVLRSGALSYRYGEITYSTKFEAFPIELLIEKVK